MTEHIIMAWEIIFPVGFMLILGILCRMASLADQPLVEKGNRLVFYVLLPIMNFVSIYNIETTAFFTPDNGILLGITVFMTLFGAFAYDRVLRLYQCPTPVRGTIVQTAYQTNGVIFALPIITDLCGRENLAPMMLLVLVLSPIYVILSISVLSPIRGAEVSRKKIIKEIVCNPIILASLAAVLLGILEIRLPVLMTNTLDRIGNITTPFSFILLGASLRLGGFLRNGRKLILISLLRLVLIPGICLLLGWLTGLGSIHMAVIACLMGSPVAVSSFTMAQNYGADAKLAAEIVAATTLVAAPTVFLWIAGLGYFGII